MIMLLIRQFDEEKAKKTPGFSDTIVSPESLDDIIVPQKTLEEYKPRVPDKKPYSKKLFFELQKFERSSEHIFYLPLVTYRKDVDTVFFRSRGHGRIRMTIWYRRGDKLQRLNII